MSANRRWLRTPLVFLIFSSVFNVGLAVTLAPRIGVQMVWIAVPLGWLANLLISGAQYRTGKWRKVYAEKASMI